MKRDIAYTRQKYIHRVPQSMISRFTLGDSTAEYEFVVSLIASKDARISSNALEARERCGEENDFTRHNYFWSA